MMKIYSKKGAHNFTEKRLVKALENAIGKKLLENEDFTFKTARNFDELKALHNSIVIENVPFEEVKAPKKPKVEDDKIIDATRNNETGETIAEEKPLETPNSDEPNSDFDPLNRQEPIVRDYVLQDEFAENPNKPPINNNGVFEEPKSFRDSFETFDSEGKSNQNIGKKEDKKEPINPAYKTSAETSTKAKKRNKRFAKYIVEAVCYLLKKGVVWYATKDITEEKLLEYQLSGDVSAEALQLLVALDSGQQSTVKRFFTLQCTKADKMSNIGEAEKEDLAEALEEYLESKGITPSAGQNLLTVAISVLGKPVMDGFMMSATNKSIIDQLKSMHTNTQDYYEEPRQQPQPTPEPQQTKSEDKSDVEEKEAEVEVDDLVEIDKVEETKE